MSLPERPHTFQPPPLSGESDGPTTGFYLPAGPDNTYPCCPKGQQIQIPFCTPILIKAGMRERLILQGHRLACPAM